jgi:glycerophosphoryl diester phosphodiesterase
MDNLPRPTIFAHRGASAHAPENTLAAFELAVVQKADAIELDAKLCADGQIVVFHDQTVDRTTNGTGKVLDLTLPALKEMDAGSWFGEDFKGEHIPTLDEVFEAVGKKIFINVELTNYASLRDQLPDKVARLIKQHKLQESVLFSSFNPLALRRAHQLLPEIPLGLLVLPGFAGIWARTWLGPWLVPYRALHPTIQGTSEKLITQQHARNNRVHTWTVNNPSDMKKLFQWGVDGIFTDDPPLAQKIRDEVKA